MSETLHGDRLRLKALECSRSISAIVLMLVTATGCSPSGPGELRIDVPNEPVSLDSDDINLGVTNTGGTAIRILEVHSSCGCTIVDGEVPSMIQAGERASIPLRVSGSFYGTKDVRVTITTDADRNAVQVASCQVAGLKLQPPYATQKSYIFRTEVHRADQKAETSFKIHTLEEDNSAFWLSAFDCSDDNVATTVTCEEEKPFVDETVERVYQVSFSVRNMTSHPNGTRFRLLPVLARPSGKREPVVVVEVDVVPILQAYPATLTLRANGETRTTQQLLIAARHEEPCVITVPPNVPAGLRITPQQQNQGSGINRQLFSIEVDWKSFTPTTDALDLTFQTDDAECPFVRVPVRFVRQQS